MNTTKFTIKEDILNEKELRELNARYEWEISRHSDLNPERIYHVLYAYHLIRKMLNNDKKSSKIKYGISIPIKDYAVIYVSGGDLLFNESELFARAIDLASHFDISLLKEGMVELTIGFCDLIK